MESKEKQKSVKVALKEEIIRLGLENYPSLHQYQKKYKRGVAPSPNGAIKITGMRWGDLMNELGFQYGNIKSRYGIYEENQKEKIISEIIFLMNKENTLEYMKVVKSILPRLGVTYSALRGVGIDWWHISAAYEDKYGKIKGKRNTYQSKKTLDGLPANALLKEFFELLEKKKAKDIKGVHYMSKSYAEKRFGTADVDDLRKIYEIIKNKK